MVKILEKSRKRDKKTVEFYKIISKIIMLFLIKIEQ